MFPGKPGLSGGGGARAAVRGRAPALGRGGRRPGGAGRARAVPGPAPRQRALRGHDQRLPGRGVPRDAGEGGRLPPGLAGRGAPRLQRVPGRAPGRAPPRRRGRRGRGQHRPRRVQGAPPGRSDGEAALRRHLGVCFDACHMAGEFEDGPAGLAALRRAGIRVGKVRRCPRGRRVPGRLLERGRARSSSATPGPAALPGAGRSAPKVAPVGAGRRLGTPVARRRRGPPGRPGPLGPSVRPTPAAGRPRRLGPAGSHLPLIALSCPAPRVRGGR